MPAKSVADFLRHWMTQLGRSEAGISITEFSLMLPVFITTLLLGMDTLWFVHAHQEASRLATSTADLAARYRASLDEKDVKSLFLGARLSTDGVDFLGKGRLVLSSVTRNTANNGHWVRWQRCQGSLTNASQLGVENAGQSSSSVAKVAGMTLNPGDNVMYAEVFYKYQPLFFTALYPKDKLIKYSASFMAREIALPSLTNVTNLGNSSKALC